MASEVYAFPHRDITEKEAGAIAQMWEYDAAHYPARVQFFLEAGGKPLLEADAMLAHFMKLLRTNTLQSLDCTSPAGQQAFNRGVLFYAGVYSYISHPDRIPVQREAMAQIGDLDPRNFILSTRDKVRDEAQHFTELLNGTLPVLAPESRLNDLVEIGAGAVHLVVTESDRFQLAPDVLAGAHPELADLDLLGELETDPDMADLKRVLDAGWFLDD